MPQNKPAIAPAKAMATLAVALIFASYALAAPKLKVLHAFGLGNDGAGLWASLAFDSEGNLYGTTSGGGAHGDGTVFELTPKADGAWSETILHSFPSFSDDGGLPQSHRSLTLPATFTPPPWEAEFTTAVLFSSWRTAPGPKPSSTASALSQSAATGVPLTLYWVATMKVISMVQPFIPSSCHRNRMAGRRPCSTVTLAAITMGAKRSGAWSWTPPATSTALRRRAGRAIALHLGAVPFTNCSRSRAGSAGDRAPRFRFF
jgi:uncharacterized repeat protein (TIGR03803 family)